MAEAALIIGWGEVARGREKRALDVYSDSLQYYGRLHKRAGSNVLTWPFLTRPVAIWAASSCCGARRSRSTRPAVPRSFSGYRAVCS